MIMETFTFFVKDVSRRLGVNPFYEYQIPFYGKYQAAKDNARYWEDYYRNTGFRPRYPGRQYGTSAATGLISEAKSLYGSAKKIYG